MDLALQIATNLTAPIAHHHLPVRPAMMDIRLQVETASPSAQSLTVNYVDLPLDVLNAKIGSSFQMVVKIAIMTVQF